MLPEKAREGSQATKNVFCPFGGIASHKKVFFALSEGSQAAEKCFLPLARGRKPQKNDFCPLRGVASHKKVFFVLSEGSQAAEK